MSSARQPREQATPNNACSASDEDFHGADIFNTTGRPGMAPSFRPRSWHGSAVTTRADSRAQSAFRADIALFRLELVTWREAPFSQPYNRSSACLNGRCGRGPHRDRSCAWTRLFGERPRDGGGAQSTSCDTRRHGLQVEFVEVDPAGTVLECADVIESASERLSEEQIIIAAPSSAGPAIQTALSRPVQRPEFWPSSISAARFKACRCSSCGRGTRAGSGKPLVS